MNYHQFRFTSYPPGHFIPVADLTDATSLRSLIETHLNLDKSARNSKGLNDFN